MVRTAMYDTAPSAAANSEIMVCEELDRGPGRD